MSLDRDGRTLGRLTGPGGDERAFFRPRGIAATADGRLYVVNDNRITVYRLNERGDAS